MLMIFSSPPPIITIMKIDITIPGTLNIQLTPISGIGMTGTEQCWNALVKDCVHADGKLGYVQGTGKEPKDGQPVNYNSTPDFEDYGLGCFLLAGTEVYKLK